MRFYFSTKSGYSISTIKKSGRVALIKHTLIIRANYTH